MSNDIFEKEKIKLTPETGFNLVKPGLREHNRGDKKVAILTNGYMLGRAHKSWLILIGDYVEVSLYDVWKLKPLNQELLKSNLKSSRLPSLRKSSYD